MMPKPILSFRLLLLLGLLLLAHGQLLAQQTDTRSDTLQALPPVVRLLPDTLRSLPPAGTPAEDNRLLPASSEQRQCPDTLLRLAGSGMPLIPYYRDPSPMFRGDYYTNGLLFATPRSIGYASGKQNTVPGIGRFNEAALGYQLALTPRLTFQLDASVMKVNMLHAVGQTFATSGRFSYRLGDRLSLNAFGTYAPGTTFGLTTHSYGGTLSLEVTDRFGLEMGVQRYYNMMRGWETVPVVIPTFKFNQGKIGLDVGGLLYEILQHTVFDKKRGGGPGPTILPPSVQVGK